MQASNYKPGDVTDFVVASDDTDFFYLQPVSGDKFESPVRLKKLRFQKGQQAPATLRCRVKAVEKGVPVIDHYLPLYVKWFYYEAFRHGRVSELTVVSAASQPTDPICLTDNYGIIFRVVDPNMMVSVGQKVRCVFTVLNDSRYQIKIKDDNLALPFLTIDDIAAELGDVPLRIVAIAKRVLATREEFATARDEFEKHNPIWVMTALRQIEHRLFDWFVLLDIRRRPHLIHLLVTLFRRVGLLLLEGSNFTSGISSTRRDSLRLALTEIIESADPVLLTIEILARDRKEEYMAQVMNNLKRSGYLYHPKRQLSVMMLLYRLYPDMISEWLRMIFDVIMGRDLATWTAEPFRKAFVDQFEVYINHTRCQVDALPGVDDSNEKHRVERVITALALQLFIADPEKFAPYQRNMSLFYRYIALMQPYKASELLTKSLVALLGVNVPLNFDYDTIKSPMMMMTAASILPDSCRLSSLSNRWEYKSDRLSIAIGHDGLTISDLDSATSVQNVPEGIFSWLTPNIYGDRVEAPVNRTLAEHDRWWRRMEASLLLDEAQPMLQSSVSTAKRKAAVGDEVLVIITGSSTAGTGDMMLHCEIADDNYIGGCGVLPRDQIVAYRVTYVSRSIMNNESTGRPYYYLAKVKKVNSDGTYIFSLQDEVHRALNEMLDFNTTYRAVITRINATSYSAICDCGFGLYLNRQKGEDGIYGPTDKVTFRLSDTSRQNMITGDIVGEDDGNKPFDKNTAFATLMHELALEKEADDVPATTDAEAAASTDESELMTDEIVHGLIDCLRFYTVLIKDMVEAFDYLRLAKLLALAIDDTKLAEQLSVSAEMLLMHEYFATNDTVDAERLQALRKQCEGRSINGRFWNRLLMLTYMGDETHNEDLQQIIMTSSTLMERRLAQLVLSYNLLCEQSDTESGKLTESVAACIKKALHVTHDLDDLKYYGPESQYVEFKSSTVYPAGGKSEANPAQQQFVILKVIASFLNAGGGTLYIGVNDVTHYESGLWSDFEYYKNTFVRFGKFSNKIKSIDNLCVSLSNLINYTFGNTVARLVEVDVDHDAHKDVIVIKVKQSVDPVELNGAIYERQSSTIRELSDPVERARFEEERSLLHDLKFKQNESQE